MEAIKSLIFRVYLKLRKVISDKRTITFLVLAFALYKIYKFPIKTSSSTFLDLVNQNKVESIDFFGKVATYKLKKGGEYIANYVINNFDDFSKQLYRNHIHFNHYSDFEALLLNPNNQLFGISAISTYLIMDLFKEKNREEFVKYNYSINTISKVFDNLVTTKENKDKFILSIDQLINPEKYVKNRIKPTKGILLYGKPGTGKTLVAKCLSKLTGLNFINTCSSEYIEIYVGTGPKKIREYFKQARNNTPSIIFIDELEAIGMKRPSDQRSFSNHSERISTLNQLLAEMDGVESNEGILIIAATNREDVLDPAILRPGRFDFKINLDLPSKEERIDLIKLYLSKHDNIQITNIKKLTEDTDFMNELSLISEGCTGAIIEDVVNKTLTITYSKEEDFVDKKHLLETMKKSKEEMEKFKAFDDRNY